MRIDNPDERSFYEIECAKQQWSVRQLQRQVASSLYERLALSRDKAEVMRLASEGLLMGNREADYFLFVTSKQLISHHGVKGE